MTIDEISTIELIDELTRRCAPAIFIGTKNEGKDGGGQNTFFASCGNDSVCFGLCYEMAFNIQKRMLKDISS